MKLMVHDQLGGINLAPSCLRQAAMQGCLVECRDAFFKPSPVRLASAHFGELQPAQGGVFGGAGLRSFVALKSRRKRKGSWLLPLGTNTTYLITMPSLASLVTPGPFGEDFAVLQLA